MYNLGNSLLKSGKLKESIEAYKNSLRLDPGNMEAKYNLAFAQDRLKEQEQQQQQNQQNQDQNKDQKNQEQDQNKDQNQDQEKKDDQKENEKQDQQQSEQQQSMSREDAERLLNAIANDEKEVQEKVKEAKAAKQRVKTLKNW